MAKKVAVPSLVGTTQDSAETALTDAGLTLAKRYVSGEPDGTVYSQTPSSGKLATGEVVTIDVLRAPAAPAPVDLSAVTKSISTGRWHGSTATRRSRRRRRRSTTSSGTVFPASGSSRSARSSASTPSENASTAGPPETHPVLSVGCRGAGAPVR